MTIVTQIKVDTNRPTSLHYVSPNSTFYTALKNTNCHPNLYLSAIGCNTSKEHIYCQTLNLIRHFTPFKNVLCSTSPRTVLGPTQPPSQWVSRALFTGVKRPWRDAHHSSPPNSEVKKTWRCTSTPIRLQAVMLNYLSTRSNYFTALKALNRYYIRIYVDIRVF
jgi:hypothetical protein